MGARNRRVGVIGLGFRAQVCIPAFQSEGWEVAAVCARHRDKAEKVAATAKVRDVHTEPLELIARSDLDAIAITTPPRAHHPLAIAALNAGKHVPCEKPFALDEKQAAEMRDAANASGLTATVGHESRHASRAYIKQLPDEDCVGRLGFASGRSFAATPARGARIAIMGDRGTLIAEQPGPNPVDSGVVIGSHDGTPLAQLPMPSRYSAFTDDRDPRLACFRRLVRNFSRGIDEATSPSPNFADGWRRQQVMDAVRTSSREGRTVTID
jgi:predicted dehydrogenase